MADDLNMTTILSPLSAAAQIRRVKPTDPENERRPPDEHQRRRKKRRRDKNANRDADAVAVDLKKEPAGLDRKDTTRSAKPQQETKKDGPEKEITIDIRV